MIEIIVVLVIIGLVFLGGMSSLKGSKGTAQASRARTVAVQLGEAVQQFQRDHGGRVPAQPGTDDWGGGFVSPVDRGNGSKPYLSATASESLHDGSVSLETSNGRTARRPSATGRVRYLADPARNTYVLVAYADRSGRLAPECYVTNSTPAGVAALTRSAGVRKRC